VPKQTIKPRILVVDDSKVMRRAISKILSKEYDVIEAEHGEDAWTLLLNDNTIQVVFTDLGMPYLDGYGLLERIRSSDESRLKELPVIIITGQEDDEKAQQDALNSGATDFISKPFESVQLKARASAHVRFEQTARKLTETSEKLESQAAIDESTGLGGRQYFCKTADETLAYIKRNGGRLILVRMDIDNFDFIFIKNGKTIADKMISTVGKRLSKMVRNEDKLARVGLAKFALLLLSNNLDDTKKLAERIRKDIASLSFKSGKKNLKITVSISILEPQIDQDSDIKTLMAQAESYLDDLTIKGGNAVACNSTVVDILGISGMHYVDVTTAIRLVNEGRHELVRPHMDKLLNELHPLLEFLTSEKEKD